MKRKMAPINDKAMEVAVNTLIDTVTTAVEKIFDKIADAAANFLGGMSLQDIAKIHEDDIDALILKKQRLEELEYVGGKFFINYMDDEYFKMSTELWFKNKEGKLVEVTAKSKPTETKYLSEQAKTDLKANKKAEFDIKPPKEEKSKE